MKKMRYIFSNCYNKYEEIDNFDNMQKSPVIFFRYTIEMLVFLIAIYIVHLNFSIVNALLALVLLIVVEIFLEVLAGVKYSKNKKKNSMVKNMFSFIDRNFHFVILFISFCIRLFLYSKLKVVSNEDYGSFIHLLNCLNGAIISLFVYLFAKELFSKRAGQIVSIMYSISMFVAAYCSVPTSQHFFAVLVLMAIYLLISKRYASMNYLIKHSIVALILAGASIIRPEGIIYLFAVIIYLFANSLIKNNRRREKVISILLIVGIYLIVNVLVFGVIELTELNNRWTNIINDYKEMFEQSEKGISQFEINQKDYWNNINYEFVSGNFNIEKARLYDSTIFLFCAINTAIIIIYCKMKNIEDERLFILYIIILINFFIYGFIKDNSMYSYIAKISVYILAAGGITIIKKNAEFEAMEKNKVNLLKE